MKRGTPEFYIPNKIGPQPVPYRPNRFRRRWEWKRDLIAGTIALGIALLVWWAA